MASGRTEEVAKRNRNIKRRYTRGELPGALAKRYGISRQQVHVILADPNSGLATARTPRQIVRPLEQLGAAYNGILHGTEAGYRAELAAGLETCDDCKTAHAVVISEQVARRVSRSA